MDRRLATLALVLPLSSFAGLAAAESDEARQRRGAEHPPCTLRSFAISDGESPQRLTRPPVARSRAPEPAQLAESCSRKLPYGIEGSVEVSVSVTSLGQTTAKLRKSLHPSVDRCLLTKLQASAHPKPSRGYAYTTAIRFEFRRAP